MLDQVSNYLISKSGSSTFMLSALIYLLTSSLVSKLPAADLSSFYSAAQATKALSATNPVWNLLVAVLQFPLYLSFAVAASITLSTAAQSLKVPAFAEKIIIVPLATACFQLNENALLLVNSFGQSALLLQLAAFLSVFRWVASSINTVLLVFAAAVLTRDFVLSVGRDGRQKINKKE